MLQKVPDFRHIVQLCELAIVQAFVIVLDHVDVIEVLEQHREDDWSLTNAVPICLLCFQSTELGRWTSTQSHRPEKRFALCCLAEAKRVSLSTTHAVTRRQLCAQAAL